MSNVRVVIGDLFESGAHTLTNTVNTEGVMGKGIALQFRRRFPVMYNDYLLRCERAEVHLGEPYLFKPLVPPWVLNFPTKERWRSLTRVADVIAGLDHVAKHYRDWGIESLAVPPLGCGEGGLEWRVVGPVLYRGLTQLDIPVELYAPFGTPHRELTPEFLDAYPASDVPETRVPIGAVALAAIVGRITSQQYRYPIGRVSFQKLAYFATQAGIPTGLEFERRPYGPFAADLKPMVSKLINNGLIAERHLGRMIEVVPGPTLQDAVKAFDADLDRLAHPIDRVADLFLRLPSTRTAELAASAHYVADRLAERARHHHGAIDGDAPPEAGQEARVGEQAVIDEVTRWKARKDLPPNESAVRSAVRTLDYLGWIDVEEAPDRDELLFA